MPKNSNKPKHQARLSVSPHSWPEAMAAFMQVKPPKAWKRGKHKG